MMTMSSVVQQQEQQVPAVGAISKSGRHQLDSDFSGQAGRVDLPLGHSGKAPPGKQLSVVLPNHQAGAHQKSLLTPTIVTTAGSDPVASSPGHLFSSLAVQLSGQEVGLFTGLPSCTPTSADGLAAAAANLTGINPFFWGVGPNQTPAGQQTDHEERSGGQDGGADQQQQASESNVADSKRRQLSKLQLDQLQQNAMILSPLSFLLSPEQEAWLRLGQQQSHPLGASAVEQQEAASLQQHRLTARDLTNHQPAATTFLQARGGHNPQISTNSINQQQPTRGNTLNLQPQRPPEVVQQHAPATCNGGPPPVAHNQNHFPHQQPTVLVMSGKSPNGGDFCHQQPLTSNAPVPASGLQPMGQPTPMIATLHYDGLHYDPHLQQLYLAQQQQQQQQHQDMYHHQIYPHQMAAIVASAPTPTATTSTITYQPQPQLAYATTQNAPMTQVETLNKLEQREAPVIVMEASSSPPPLHHQHQFSITSASNSSARSSVSRDTTINVEVLVQNGLPNAKASQQKTATNSNSAPDTEVDETKVVVKKKSKGGRKKKQVTHEELMARKNRSKERNRVAAKRCRQKRKQFLDELRDRIDNLSDSNKRVLKENSLLKSELELLRKHHKTCRLISQ